jgi:hypothetical protein
MSEEKPSWAIDGFGGAMYLSQSPAKNNLSTLYHDGTLLITELATFYLGVGITKSFGKKLSLVGRGALIPVLPLSNNGFSLSTRYQLGAEYQFDDFILGFRADLANFNVNQNTGSALFAKYTLISLGVGFHL